MDRQQYDANSQSYCYAVRLSNKTVLIQLFYYVFLCPLVLRQCLLGDREDTWHAKSAIATK